MSIAEIKEQLIQLIQLSDDKEFLEAQLIVLSRGTSMETDWWNDLSVEQRESLSRSIRQAASNEIRPHSDVRKGYAKWL